MEEEKLLRILKLIAMNIIVIYASYMATALASMPEGKVPAEDIDWAKTIAASHQTESMNHLQEMMQTEGFDQNLRDSVLKPRPVLQIFVSSSMPRQLLKAYAKEASRYDGVLVFRGLPQGSFRKITDLVMDISDKNQPCAMQIDDEAFTGFGVGAVPAIVLSKPAAQFDEQKGEGKFDKVYGNITIKAALELFSESGDLATNAKELLK